VYCNREHASFRVCEDPFKDMRNKGYKEGWHRVFSCIRAFARQCDAYRRPLGTNVSQLEMAGGLVLKRFIIQSGASSRGLP
jgi:hypothetical protein